MPNVVPHIKDYLQAQEPKAPRMKESPVFYRNLEEALDTRRADQNLIVFRDFKDGVDFSSNDFLSLATSGLLRMAFFDELAKHPNFRLGATSSRLLDGNSSYMETIEKEVAEFHNAEDSIIVNSGYEANGAIYTAIPRPGDAIVYDELVHASTHDGMKNSVALTRVSFRHNDVDSLEETLVYIRDTQPLIQKGERSVIISVESIYSMDGDVCPLKEFVDIAKEVFPLGNAQFVVDEAHGTGVVGRQGGGLVQELGLEKEIAIRMHTFGKALASNGACILSNSTVKTMLINYARGIIYTTAPSFLVLAGIRSGYNLLKADMTKRAQERVQYLVRLFFKTIQEHPAYERAAETGILRVPLADGSESRPFVTQVVPVWTRPHQNLFLVFHLQMAKYCAYPIDFPVVPKGAPRVRCVFHNHNTDEEVKGLAHALYEWAQEMLDIEDGKVSSKIPVAARQAFAWTAEAETNGNGVAAQA
ncbi:Pyridoxal phosphate-dependent transferase major domain [Fusarium albosuccineum]|uniref:Pyridoxal phosphate-dependent transferase major domain n=1 Tax=Fusarium albosuccineum TaxID=1237068 RepID=A0A8H4PJ21_9HYPO|nr:Pyridoxal phosphate-dependent transferase major domain [Fusarium albosuccineum]